MLVTECQLKSAIKECVCRILSELKLDGEDYATLSALIKKGYLVHGTGADFASFDDSKINGGNRAEFGYGMYFTDAPYKALEYGRTIYYTEKSSYNFLDLDGPADETVFRELSDTQEQLAMAENALENVRNISEYDYYTQLIAELTGRFRLTQDEQFVYGLFERAIQDNGGGSLENVFKSVRGKLPENYGPTISSFLLKIGYDGVKCGNQYVIFNYGKLNANLKK